MSIFRRAVASTCPFMAGAKVRHKSGGPWMIVAGARLEPDTDTTRRQFWVIYTRWFVQKTQLPHDAVFFAFELDPWTEQKK